MTTTTTTATTDAAGPPVSRTGTNTAFRPWHRVALVAAAATWATVAFVHPTGGDGTVYDGLRSDVGLWLGIHFAQLVLSIALAVGLWSSVRHLRSPAARLARGSIAVYLVFFAAMDSIVGIATGLVVHHANSSTGAVREGAIDTAEYLMTNPLAGNTGILWAVATTALVGATVGSAMALRRAGAARATWLPILAGLLLANHMGPLAAVGVVALGAGLHRHFRHGLR